MLDVLLEDVVIKKQEHKAFHIDGFWMTGRNMLVLYILIGPIFFVYVAYCCWTGRIWLFVLQFIYYWPKYRNVCCHNSGWMVENVTKIENFSRTFKFQKVSDIFFTCMCFKSRLIGWYSSQNNYFLKRAK